MTDHPIKLSLLMVRIDCSIGGDGGDCGGSVLWCDIPIDAIGGLQITFFPECMLVIPKVN